MVSGGSNSFRQPVAFQYIDFKSHLLSLVIVECDEKAAHIEQALHLGINTIEQRIRLKFRAQCSSYFIYNVELFAAPRCLLNQITILPRHANLVAQRQKQPQLRRSEISIVRRSKKQHSEDALFCLQTDSHDGTQVLSEQQFSYVPERFFFLQSCPLRVRLQIAEHNKSTKACHEVNDVIV